MYFMSVHSIKAGRTASAQIKTLCRAVLCVNYLTSSYSLSTIMEVHSHETLQKKSHMLVSDEPHEFLLLIRGLSINLGSLSSCHLNSWTSVQVVKTKGWEWWASLEVQRTEVGHRKDMVYPLSETCVSIVGEEKAPVREDLSRDTHVSYNESNIRVWVIGRMLASFNGD